MSKIFFAIFFAFASFISASAVTDEKHCAPRACCGCPGNGKSVVKTLMNLFLDKIATDDRVDAYKLVSTQFAGMDDFGSVSCDIGEDPVPDYFNTFFPLGSVFYNVDFEYVMKHDGTIEVMFLAVVTKPDTQTKAYNMHYVWTSDAQCNWHISKIFATDTACLLRPPTL